MNNIETVDLVCSTYQSADSDHERPAVVLLHAFPFDARLWHPVALQLAMHGWKVIVPNLRGCGASPAGHDAASMELLGADVWACLDTQKVSRPIIIGISLGGYVVMEMLRQRPEAVWGIGLIDTKATADNEAGRAQRIEVAQSMRESGDVKSFAKAMLPRLIASEHANDDSAVARTVSAWMQEAHPLTIAWLQEAMANRPDSVDTLTRFKGDALLVRGRQDLVCTTDDYDLMFQALKNREYTEVYEAGHLPPIEDPGMTSLILVEWLKKVAVAEDKP